MLAAMKMDLELLSNRKKGGCNPGVQRVNASSYEIELLSIRKKGGCNPDVQRVNASSCLGIAFD